MVTFLNLFLPIVSLVIAILAALGGWSAFRLNRSQQTNSIQETTINALKIRVDTLEKERESDTAKIAQLIDELAQERRLMKAVRHALARRGLHIEVDDDYVTLVDAQGHQSTQVPNLAKVKPVRPVKLQPIINDDDTTA